MMAAKSGGKSSSEGDYLLLVGVVVLAVLWPKISEWAAGFAVEVGGSGVQEVIERWSMPALIGLVVLGVLLAWKAVLGSIRTRRRDAISTVLVEALPKGWEPSSSALRISWLALRAKVRRILVDYPADAPDRDPEWRRKFVDAVAYRAGLPANRAVWMPDKLRVSIVRRKPEPEIAPTPAEVRRAGILTRVHLILAPLFGSEVAIRIPEWTDGEGEVTGGFPLRIEVSYQAMTRDTSPQWRRRLETVTALKVPPGNARWEADYRASEDRIVLRHRKPLPENLVHPGPGLWSGLDGLVLPYGVDERGQLAGWALAGPAAKQRPTVHTLIVGPTGTGKTSVLRSLAVAATGQGVWVLGADPKRIELTPFRGWPGIPAVASTPDDLGLLILAVKNLMDARYEQVEQGSVRPDELEPVVLILDELLILKATLNRWWAANKGDETLKVWGTKAGTQHPALGMVAELLALARSANIRLAEGVQRPDASLFEDGARDNLRHRISLNRLSPQGAEMVWQDSYTGTDLPMIAGRAMASPDGGTPLETQMFWTPDPREETPAMASLRSAAEGAFAGRALPEGLDLSGLSDRARNVAEISEDAEDGDRDLIVIEHTDQLSTQLVGAGEIMPGDKVLTDDGEVLEVRSAEEIADPDDPEAWDWVQLVLAGPSGERIEESPVSSTMARVIEL